MNKVFNFLLEVEFLEWDYRIQDSLENLCCSPRPTSKPLTTKGYYIRLVFPPYKRLSELVFFHLAATEKCVS